MPFIILFFLFSFFASFSAIASQDTSAELQHAVDHVIKPLMEKNHIPGMSVAVTIRGKNYFFNYGIASKKTLQPVTNHTLFEIGSDTKTFTATLAAYAAKTHRLSFSDHPSQYFPLLRHSAIDQATLLNLGTQTSGLPLFVPDTVKSDAQWMHYLKNWKPTYPIGTYRVYSNNGIGLLGKITAKSLHMSYENALQTIILNPLALHETYIHIPDNKMQHYAQGYTANDQPIRLHDGAAWQEAYGIKTSSFDLIRFVEANLNEITIPADLAKAIDDTHTSYFNSNYLTQDLAWEQYPYPTTLKTLLTGNGATYLQPTAVTKITPPKSAQANAWVNKTGGTDGFSSYMVFIPAKKIGLVMMANKQYPNEDKVIAGYEILTHCIRRNYFCTIPY